jgi:hypothetical protein
MPWAAGRRSRRVSRSAPDRSAGVHLFRVTHPFHPLRGQDLELVNERHCFGEAFVFFYGPRGDLSSVPAAWTDLVGPDPFVAVSAGRACFRPRDLLRLAVLLEGIGERMVSGELRPLCKGNDVPCPGAGSPVACGAQAGNVAE